MNITLQINQFCSCDGCLRKVKKALRKLDGARLLAMDSDIGKFTISTTEHPEVVKRVFKHEFPGKNITILQHINNSHPTSMSDVSDIAGALAIMSQVDGVESVEYTQFNSVRFIINNSHNQPTRYSLPSTPHNLQGPNGFYVGHAPPPPPPPPPPQNYTRPYVPPPPPPPPPPPTQTYIRPSAPPMPPSPPAPPSDAYIKPSAQSHDFNYHQHDSCTIL